MPVLTIEERYARLKAQRDRVLERRAERKREVRQRVKSAARRKAERANRKPRPRLTDVERQAAFAAWLNGTGPDPAAHWYEDRGD